MTIYNNSMFLDSIFHLEFMQLLILYLIFGIYAVTDTVINTDTCLNRLIANIS